MKEKKLIFKKSFISLVFWILSLFVFNHFSTVHGQVTGIDNFQIRIPNKPGDFAIYNVSVIVTLNGDNPVTFEITNPDAEMYSSGSLSPGSSYVDHEFTNTDWVTITPPANLTDDPQKFRYVIDITPLSNSDVFCQDIMTAAELWTIEVTTGSPKITGVCLNSFDKNVVDHQCSGWSRLIESTAENQVATAYIDGSPAPQACVEIRPPVDVILVLDKSGSMNSMSLGSDNRPKIEVLYDAVKDFVNVWSDIRAAEASPPADQIGMIFFNQDAHWMDDVGIAAWSGYGGLNTFNDTICTDIVSHIEDVGAGGSTSMGDGLILADSNFDYTNDHRRVILLMSNGKENTTMRVRVIPDPPADPVTVQTYVSGDPGGATDLPNQSQYNVYAVTVGTSTAVSAEINERIAAATGGFYINSEDNAELIRVFFLELLQNFLKFNTWETVRMVSGIVESNASYKVDFPVTSTTKKLSIILLWNKNIGALHLKLTPPGYVKPIVRKGNGFIRINLELPLKAPFDPTGIWNALIENVEPVKSNLDEIPFDFFVMGDDLALKSNLSIAKADYVTGDKIKLTAKITDFGKPVLNVGSNPSDKIFVRLLKPGVGIGDLLSDSGAGTTQPSGDDLMTEADAKLHNELKDNPGKLDRGSDTVTLLDNGKSANGDEVAGDGIYTGFYKADVPGHYNFLFAIEGKSNDAGRFSRQQLKTVGVEAVPDPAETEIQTDVRRTEDGRYLDIKMIPRTRYGHRMGPGWKNYFWFSTKDRKPFKANDNLDGTYTTSQFFGSGPIPKISLHFLRVSTVIEDNVTPDDLSISLDDKTELIDSVISHMRFAISLRGGIGIPHRDLDVGFDPGFSFNAGFEFMLSSFWSVEAIFGYHNFADGGAGTNMKITQFSGNLRFFYPLSMSFRPFLNAGAGTYNLNPGNWEFGFNGGAGIDIKLTNQLALECAYNYHRLPDKIEFSTIQGGIRIRF